MAIGDGPGFSGSDLLLMAGIIIGIPFLAVVSASVIIYKRHGRKSGNLFLGIIALSVFSIILGMFLSFRNYEIESTREQGQYFEDKFCGDNKAFDRYDLEHFYEFFNRL